jgi:hypothetical protein
VLQDLGLLDGEAPVGARQLVRSSLLLADSDGDGALCLQVGCARRRHTRLCTTQHRTAPGPFPRAPGLQGQAEGRG